MIEGVSLIIPCRNEELNLNYLYENLDIIPEGVEIVLIEGGSSDGTWEICQKIFENRSKGTKILQQTQSGKMNAVVEGARVAKYPHIAIWDADFTVRTEDQVEIVKLYMDEDGQSLISGARLNRHMQRGSMQTLNFIGNWVFAILLTISLQNRIKDSLCGSKVFPAELLLNPQDKKVHDLDPFGDHSLLLEARLRQMKIKFIDVKYRRRMFGETNIHRFKDGWKLIKLIPYIYFSLRRANLNASDEF